MSFKQILLAFTGAAAMTIAQSDAQKLDSTLANPPAGTLIKTRKISTLPDSSTAWLLTYRRDTKNKKMNTNFVIRTTDKTDSLKVGNIESAYYNAVSHQDGSEITVNISRRLGSAFYTTQRETSKPLITSNLFEIGFLRNLILEKTFQDPPETLPPRRKTYGYGPDNPEI